MNNDSKSGLIAIVIGGLLFVVCPIVLILFGLFSTPVSLKIFLLLWLLICLMTFTFVKDKSIKLGITLPVTIIYAFSFAIWYAEDELDGYFGGGGLGDTIGMFLAPFASLVPIYFLGSWIKSRIDEKKKNKINKKIDILNNELITCQQIIKNVEKELNGRQKFFSLFSLLEFCGAELTQIKTNNNVNNMTKLTEKLKEQENKIKDINNEIKQLSSSISGGQ